ncbi:unnamed protein product [Moneuplotes crassus]|uniref:Uncharacterized protein n=1 Tax=Euplotes crassus TaxID=5936 RepID=A0AAD1U042_EUPCR|nr:unnamed protein product [Moneuplotes crassus]
MLHPCTSSSFLGPFFIKVTAILVLSLCFIQPIEAQVLSVTPSDSMINIVTSYSFQITGVSSLNSGDIIKATIPTGITVSGVSSGATTTCSLTTLGSGGVATSPVTTCTYNANDGGARTLTFTLGQSYSGLLVINLATTNILQNPNSVRFLDPFILNVGSTTINTHSTITYTAASLASASVTNLAKTAGSPTTMTFTFRITNQIPANGFIRINWPSEVQFKLSSADGLVSVTIYGESKTGFTTSVSQISRQFTISGLFSSAVSAEAKDIVIAIQSLNNPDSQVESGSFTITTLDSSSNAIDQQSSGLTVTSSSPGTISLQSITPSTTSVDQELTVQIYENTDISPSNSFLRVTWPSEVTYVASGTLTCTMVFGFSANTPPCSVDTTNNYMTLSYYRNTVHLYTVGTFKNPLGALTTSSWKLEVFDSSNNIIMRQETGIAYTTTVQAITVGSASRLSAYTTVAIQANYSLSFTIKTRLLSDSTITLIFPIDQVKYNFATKCFNGGTDLSCTLSDTNSTHFQTTITQWCVSGAECAADSTLSFTLVNAINPSWIVSPLTSSVIIRTSNVQLTDTPTIDEITSGVQFSPTLTPGTLTSFSVTKDSATNKVGEQTSWAGAGITFTTATAIPANGKIYLTFPSETVYKATSTEVICKDASSDTLTCSSTSDSANNIQTVTITSACTSGCTAGGAISIQLEEVYNPGSTKPVQTNIQAQTQTSEGYVIDSGIASSATGFGLVANSFTSVTTNAPTTSIVVGAIPQYRFTIALKNSIPSSGGKLEIAFPSEIQIQSSGTCTAVIVSTSHICTLSNSANTVTATFSSTAVGGSSLVITITNGVKNPTTGQQSSPITFKSTVTESSTKYDIDQDLTTVRIQPNVYGTLTSTSVTRLNSSLINTDTELDIKATSANPIPSLSTIKVEYPLDQVQLSVASTSALTFFQVSSAGTVGSALTPISVATSSTHITVTFREWCSIGGNPCPASSENIRFRTIGFKNPTTTFPPSNSFKIYVDTSSSLIVDSIESSLYATPSIQAGPLTSVSITRDSNLTGDVITYTIKFTTTNSISEPNGVFLSFSPPSGLLYQGSSLACTFNGANAETPVGTSNPGAGCTATYTTVTLGQSLATLRIPFSCTSCPVGNYNVTFTGFKNPFSTQPPTGTITVATQGFDGAGTYSNYDVLDIVIESSATDLQTLAPNVCTGTAERSKTTADANTEIVANVTLTNRIISGSYMSSKIRVMVPLDQFVRTTDTIQYKQTSSSTVNAMTVVSTDSTHIVLEYEAFCSSGGSTCSDGSTMSITITQGFKNPRTVISTFTNYFIFESRTPDQLYQVDRSTANIVATPDIAQAAIANIAINFESSTVAKDGYADVSAVLGSTMLSSDFIELIFSSEFLLQTTSAVTCSKVVSGIASTVSCTSTFTSGYLSTLKVEGFCECDSTSTYTIRIHNVRTLLEAKAFTGTLTYSTKASDTESIGTGTLDLSTVTTLTAATLSPATVVRSATTQGSSSSFTLSFTTPGILLGGSTIQIGLPLNQIVLDGSAFTCADSSNNAALTCAATPTATSTYNYITINEWKCTSGNCAAGQEFGITITSAKNPAVSAVSTDPFLINFISTSSNAIFQAPSPLNASPDLEVGSLNNHVIIHQNQQYTLSTTEYIIAFDTTSEVPAAGKIIFTFPDNRILKDSSSTLTVTTGTSYETTVTGVTATYDLTNTWLSKLELTSVCTTPCAVGSYQFKISGGIKNPNYVQPLTGNFVSYTTDSSGAVINRDIKSNSDVSEILPTPIDATITRNSTALGASVGLTVSFKTTNPFPDGGKILLRMPTDQISGTPAACLKGDLSTALSCTTTTIGDFRVITIDEWCTSGGTDCAGGTTISFYIQDATNPSLLSANVATTSWQALTATAESYPIDGDYTDLKPTPNLEGVSITVNALEVASAVVYTETTISYGFLPGSNLPSGAIIEFGFPPQFAFPPTTKSCSQITPSSSTLTCTYAESGGYVTSITVSNPCVASSCLSTTPMVFQFSIKIRQNTQNVGGSFYVITKTSSTDIGYGSVSNSITILPNPFSSTSFDNSGCDLIKATCSLAIKFTTVYTFPNKASNGRISLTVPSDLTVSSTGCTATIGSNTMECSMTGKSVIATHSLTSSVAEQEIIIKFASVTNPSSTKPTNSFVILSQEQVSGSYYSIDGITSGFSYSVGGIGTITEAAVTRSALNSDNDGLKVGRNTNFLFSFKIENEVASDGVFTFIMPSDSDAQIDTTATVFACSAANCDTGTTLFCDVTAASRTVQILDYCTSSSGRSCAAGSTITICLKSTFMRNMYWIKDPLTASDSFTIKSGISGGVYFIDGISTSITATPTLLPDALSFISPQIARTGDTVDAKVDWTVYLKFSSNMLNTAGYLLMTIPDDVIYDMGEDLTVTLLTNSSSVISTVKTLYSSGAINTIRFNSVCSSSGCATGSFLNIKIEWVKNPPAQTTISTAITMSSRTSEGYLIDQGSTPTIDKLFSSLELAPVTNIKIDPENPSAGADTNYDIIFTADTSIPLNSYVLITAPTEITVSTSNAGGTAALDTCSNIFATSVTIACGLGTSGGSVTIKVTGIFPLATNTGQFGVKMGLFKNPSTAGTTGSFIIQIFSPDDNPIASKDVDTPVMIEEPVSTCDSNCLTCSGTATSCDSCKNPSDLPFLQNDKCVSACSNGYYLQGTICYSCHHSCATCDGPNSNDCISCKSDFLFEDGSCLTSCSKNTQANSANQCESTSENGSCNSNCATCSKNLDWCLTCNSGSTPIVNPTNGQCVCTDNGCCGGTLYVDTESQSCQPCSTRCKTCEISADKCFSCWNFFDSKLLDWASYKCLSECSSSGYYDSATDTCPACNRVCKTCTSSLPTGCLTCNKTEGGRQLYLASGECVLNCRRPYTENTNNNTCTRSAFDILSPVVIILLLLFIGAIITLLLSYIISLIRGRKSKPLEEAYAYLTLIEFMNRCFLLANLWVSTKVFSFAICFMDITGTAILGLFFYNLYLEPIFLHSPHFRSLFKQYKVTYLFVLSVSFLTGVNFSRLLYARSFGCLATGGSYTEHYFFVKPLNTMANFTLALTGVQIVLCVVSIFEFGVGQDVWMLAVIGLGVNLALVVMQLVKVLQTERFVRKYMVLED